MKSSIKLSLVISVMLGFFAVTGILWLHNPILQISCTLVLAVILVLLRGAKVLWKQLKLIGPFVLAWIVVYFLFALLGLRPPNVDGNLATYWFFYGLVRALLLTNLIFLAQICSAYLAWEDLLALPIGIDQKKYLILGKSLYETAFKSDTSLGLHLQLIPQFQSAKPSFSRQFRIKLSYLLALLYIIIKESERKGELIDNRIKHCHGDK